LIELRDINREYRGKTEEPSKKKREKTEEKQRKTEETGENRAKTNWSEVEARFRCRGT